MNVDIKHIKTGAVLFSFDDEKTTLKEALMQQVLGETNLKYANLERANLPDANLEDANLFRANLFRANLEGANLKGANLKGANLFHASLDGADLNYANLKGANLFGANLRGADLEDTDLEDADLFEANLFGARLKGAKTRLAVPVIKNIHQTVYHKASQKGALNMRKWHSCATTHCRAGWVVVLAGKKGEELESEVGTAAAAALIYQASDPQLERIPDFYATNDDALADMAALAAKEAASAEQQVAADGFKDE